MASPVSQRQPGSYSYHPIANDEIRLLNIGSGSDGSWPSASLHCFRLGHKDAPSYKTLSYVWGDPTARWTMDIDGKPLQVLDSLKPFMDLLQKRNDSKSRWWWIDSICIDETNLEERNSQVQMMGQIYRQCKETLVWLGPKSDDSDKAIEFLHSLSSYRFKFARQARKDEKEQSKLMAEAFLQSSHRRHWAALEKLFTRPWWTRVWTLQEFILSKEAVFYCGTKTLSRKVLDSSLFAMWLCSFANKLPVTSSWSSAWGRRRLLQWYKHKEGRKLHDSGPIPLVAMVSYFSDHNATNDHDRIYSLLGLAIDAKKLVPVTRYDTTIAEAYEELVKNFIKEYQSLDIICFSHIFNRRADESESSHLPSWVPDWRVKLEPMVVPLMVSQSGRDHIGNLRPLHAYEHTTSYYASGRTSPRVSYPSLGKISCEGILLDVVDGLSACISNNEILGRLEPMVQSTSSKNAPSNRRRSKSETFDTANDLVQQICDTLVLKRRDRYLCHTSRIQQYVIEFSNFCSKALADTTAVNWRFADWYTMNKSFQIQGFTLETLTKEFCEKVGNWSWVDFFDTSNWESYLARFSDTTIKMARRLMTTDNGLIGMAPLRAANGDLVCVLYGCSVPVVLRKRGELDEYEFIGECYMDDYMYGKAIDDLENGSASRHTYIIS
jgi:Heterokaryon incompatibility protein (HET)